MEKLSKRAVKALAVLEAGGYFRNQLEAGCGMRGEKFVTRLRNAAGQVVPGFGFQTFNELEKAGLLLRRACEKSSVWPTEWITIKPFHLCYETGCRAEKFHGELCKEHHMEACQPRLFFE